MDELDDYKQEFLQEAREYLDSMNQQFVKMEMGDLSTINEIFRAAHTIKGMAGFMGYKTLEELCHKLESVMGKIRDGEIEVSEDVVDVLLKAVDKIEEALNKIEVEDRDDIATGDVIAALEHLLGADGEDKKEEKSRVEKADKELDEPNLRVDIKLSADCAMKNVRAALILEMLSEVSKIVKVEPPEEKMDDADFDGTFSVYLVADEESVRKVMENAGEVDKYEIIEVSRRVPAKREVKQEQKHKISLTTDKERKSESIRVNIEQLDSIMNLVGELVISKGRLLQIAQEYDIPELREAVSIMDKSITSLQDEIMRIRMVKIERIFSKFPRMVRDLARKLGKKVELIMEGLETELDRTVLDEINDPLIHLVRNAVDHGIESPEERRKAGKNEVGKIILSAKREKNNIIIEIEDDGRGLDVEKIKEKAIERGIITPAEAENMSEEEIKMLIFAPGLSTKDKVTEVSGRGVGMDVVKTVVEKLGGTIKLFSEKGKGTKIRITLPPTMAIIKALLVRVGNEDYAIPLSSVVEALYVTDENYKVIHDSEFLYVRNKLIPAFRLRDLFNVNGDGNNEIDKEVGIIVEKEGEKYALIVDAITDQLEIVIKPLNSFLAKVKEFSGVTILGDGRVVPIIDVSSLLRR